jgi:hypothetical protein
MAFARAVVLLCNAPQQCAGGRPSGPGWRKRQVDGIATCPCLSTFQWLRSGRLPAAATCWQLSAKLVKHADATSSHRGAGGGPIAALGGTARAGDDGASRAAAVVIATAFELASRPLRLRSNAGLRSRARPQSAFQNSDGHCPVGLITRPGSCSRKP